MTAARGGRSPGRAPPTLIPRVRRFITLVVAAPPKVTPAPIAGAEYDKVGDGGVGLGSESEEDDMNEKVEEPSMEGLCGSGTDSGILVVDMNPKADDVVGASPSSS